MLGPKSRDPLGRALMRVPPHPFPAIPPSGFTIPILRLLLTIPAQQNPFLILHFFGLFKSTHLTAANGVAPQSRDPVEDIDSLGCLQKCPLLSLSHASEAATGLAVVARVVLMTGIL